MDRLSRERYTHHLPCQGLSLFYNFGLALFNKFSIFFEVYLVELNIVFVTAHRPQELFAQILLEANDVDIDSQPLFKELNEGREVYIPCNEYNSLELIVGCQAIDVSSEYFNSDGNINLSLNFVFVLSITLVVATGKRLLLEILFQEFDTTLFEVLDELLVSIFLG